MRFPASERQAGKEIDRKVDIDDDERSLPITRLDLPSKIETVLKSFNFA